MKRIVSILVTGAAAFACAMGDVSAQKSAPARSESRTYSAQEIGALFDRPRDVPGFLRNLKVAWDRKLLVQQAFYDENNLKRFFNGVAVVWKEPAPGMTSSFTVRYGTVTVDKSLFSGVAVELQWSHENAEAEPHPDKPGVYLPAYIEDTGQIVMDVASTTPSITWGAVQSVFGNGAQDLDTWTISEGPPGEPAGKAFMRYLYPGDDPSKLDPTRLSLAGFLVKGDPRDNPPTTNDGVSLIRVFESVRSYP